MTASYVATDGDGWKESELARAPQAILRPYHLLQTPLNRAVSAAARSGHRSFVPIQVLNSLCGAVAAGLTVLLLSRLGVPPAAAPWLAMVFALSATAVLHSRTAETAMTPMPLVIAAWLLVLPGGWLTARPEARAFAAGLSLALAVLLSLNLLVLVPSLVWAAARQRRRSGAILLLAAVLVLAPSFGLAAITERVPVERLVHWLTTHEDTEGLASTRGLVLGAARSVVGLGRLVFPASPAETAVKALLRGEEVLVSAADWLALLRNLLAAVALLGLTLRGAWRWRHPARGPVLLAVGLVAAANLVWLGSDPQYWLAAYPLLLALCWHGWPPTRRIERLGLLLVLTLVAFNLPNTMPSPLWPRWAGEWPDAAEALQRLERPCTILTPGQSALRVAARGTPQVTILDLSYAAPQLDGRDFLDWVLSSTDRALADGAVYVEGLRPPLRPRQLGAWEMVQGGHRTSREQVAEILADRYRLEAVPGVAPWLQSLRSR